MLLKNDRSYQKLRVAGRGLLGRVTYWLAEDHLLTVEQSGYVERYRRYRLDEIKAIYASRNARRLWVNLLSGILVTLLGVLPMMTSGGNPVPLTWGGIFFVFFGSILIVNSVRGPTCSVRLITAVQDAPLRGVTRMAKVEQLIAAVSSATQNLSFPGASKSEDEDVETGSSTPRFQDQNRVESPADVE